MGPVQWRVGLKGLKVKLNTFYGLYAGRSIAADGYCNTFIGTGAGYSTTSGDYNTFLGHYAGYSNSIAESNTFLGYYAGYLNTTGCYNTFVGRAAGHSNTTAFCNTFLGYGAGYSNVTGNSNTFLGYDAGYSNTMGNTNTFLGYLAGYSNTTGYSNTFLGCDAGHTNTTGNTNTFLGYNAGYANTIGYSNVFLGYLAGYSNATGHHNISLGYQAGYSNTDGSNNVFLGSRAGYNERGSNRLYIHNSENNDPLIYGEFDRRILKINGALTITSVGTVSDVSFKKEIRPLTSSLEKVSSLQGVSYEWKREEYPDKGFTKERQIGLIAQEVEPLLPEVVQTDTDGYKSVSYRQADGGPEWRLKEQQGQIQEQKTQLQEQGRRYEARLEAQGKEIAELRSMLREVMSRAGASGMTIAHAE